MDPVDIEAEHKASEARSRAAWRTCNGFILHNFKDSMESNQHPKRPDEARVEELRKVLLQSCVLTVSPYEFQAPSPSCYSREAIGIPEWLCKNI